MTNNKYSQEAQKKYLKNNPRFSPGTYGSLAEQYGSAVREPTAVDALAGDFQSMADAYSTQGPANQTSKAVLGGFGAGLQGYANEERRAKLSPIEQQTQQLLEMDAMLKAQMYEDEGQRMQTMQFFKQASVPIAELSKAAMTGDTKATNDIAKGIYSVYKSVFQDPNAGSFDHYHNGSIYYEDLETGEIKSRNLVQVMYQSGIDPMEMFGQDAAAIEAGLSPGAKMNYENTLQANRYQLENMSLQNQQLRSNIDLNKFKAQPKETPYNKEVAQHNLTYIKETREKAKNDEILANTLDEFEKVILAAQKEGAAGTSPAAALKRKYQAFSGNNKNATLGTMLQGAYFHKIKEAGGSNPSGAEFERVLATLPGIDKNPEASLAVIRQDKEFALKNVARYKQTEAFLRKNNYQGSPDDPTIFESGNNASTVIARDPETGEQQSIPLNMVEEAKRRGLEIIQ